jgi:hypothetical protein
VQLHRGDAAGLAGAARLSAALKALPKPLAVETRLVDGTDAAAMGRALAKLGAKDAVMLWWPAADVPALHEAPPPKATVYLSARMGASAQDKLPAAWKSALHLVYPYQMPDKRNAGLFYFKYWLNVRNIPLQDEVLQSEVYFAMSYLGETLTDMLDNLHRDYLIERAETMLSWREGAKAEDESREALTARYNKGGEGGAQGAMARLAQFESRKTPRPIPGRQEQAVGKREGTTVYPRLGLAQGQRFASKGAYIVRYSDEPGSELVAESEWIVP